MNLEDKYSVELMAFNKEKSIFDFCLFYKNSDDIALDCCVYNNKAYSWDEASELKEFKNVDNISNIYSAEDFKILDKEVINKAFDLAEEYFSNLLKD